MLGTMTKRARLNEAGPSCPPWLDLEPGVWEAVFEMLSRPEDKQSVRLVCKLFKASASRSIRHLNLRNFKTDDSDKLSLMAKEELPGSLVYIKSLKCYPNMKLNDYQGCHLQAFSQLEKVQLDGWGQAVGNQTLQNICSIKTLRTLILNDCHLNELSGLDSMRDLQELKALELIRCQPHGTGSTLMAAIGSLTGLTHLKIAKPYTFCDRGYSKLDGLTKLKSLQIGHSWMLGAGPERLGFVSRMTLLQKLSITKCFVCDEDLRALQGLIHLKLLGICESNRITGTLFRHLTTLTNLHGLTLEGSNQLTDEGVLNIAQLTTLQQLHLGSSSSLTLEVCKKALPALIGLVRLRLPRNILAEWPADEVSQSFPRLKSYIAAPARQIRSPGLIEDNLLRWVLLQPENLDPGRSQILDWFHDHKCENAGRAEQ